MPTSKLPMIYDIDFISNRAGVTNHFGFEVLTDPDTGVEEKHFGYLVKDFDAIQEAIDAFPVEYAAILRPLKIKKIISTRKEKIKEFTFAGLTIELDHISESRISGAALFLMRNESVPGINWDIGEGTFIEIPREFFLMLADAAGQYVQHCFNHSRDLVAAAIAAEDIFALEALEIDTGWEIPVPEGVPDLGTPDPEPDPEGD
jgi:hypothetical protein